MQEIFDFDELRQLLAKGDFRLLLNSLNGGNHILSMCCHLELYVERVKPTKKNQ